MPTLTNETVIEILDQYSIGKLVGFEYIPRGVSSENYRLETSEGTYFLKKHRPAIVPGIQSMEHVEQFFANKGIPVICGIVSSAGTRHVIVEGSCYALYPYVTGHAFEQGNLPEAVAERMGEMLARMHLLTKNGIIGIYADVSGYFLPGKAAADIEGIDRLLDHVSKQDPKTEYDRLAERGLNLKKRLLSLHAEDMAALRFDTFNLGHGDYHSGNMFFDEKLTITSMFDLDEAGPMPRGVELVKAVMLNTIEFDRSEEQMKRAGAMIRAYYRLYPFELEDIEKGMLSFYFDNFSAWQENDHYMSHDFRTDERYAKTLPNIEYLEQYRMELAAKLYGMAIQES